MMPPRWCEMIFRLGKRSMMPENTSRASAAPVSNGQPITLQISYFETASVRQPLLDVVERRDLLHALSEILLSRGRPQHQFVDALGKEMIERVDVAHSSTRLPPTPPGPDLTRQQWTPGVTSLSAGRGDDRLLVEVLPFARLVEDRG